MSGEASATAEGDGVFEADDLLMSSSDQDAARDRRPSSESKTSQKGPRHLVCVILVAGHGTILEEDIKVKLWPERESMTFAIRVKKVVVLRLVLLENSNVFLLVCWSSFIRAPDSVTLSEIKNTIQLELLNCHL